jgi:ribonucleoside-diphosphate reductase alpha chain
MEYINLPPRPVVWPAKNFDFKTACGSVFISVSMDDAGNPMEVFITKGNSGGCTQAFVEAIGRIVSISLRCGLNPLEIINQYSQIKCDNGSWQQGVRVTSCPGAVALALKSVIEGKLVSRTTDIDRAVNSEPSGDEEKDVQERMEKLAKEREERGL